MRMVLAGLILFSSFAAGQDKDPSANSVLASLVQATGWTLNNIPTDAVVHGDFIWMVDGREQLSPATYRIKETRRFKVEFDGGVVITFNEGRGATKKLDGRRTLSPYSKATVRPVVLPFFSELPRVLSGNFNIAYKGSGTRGAEPCTRIQIEPNLSSVVDPNGNARYAGTMKLCISQASGLLLEAEFVRAMDTSPSVLVPYVVRYSDYRKVGNLMVPFEYELLISGRRREKYRTLSVEFNVGLADDEFSVPKSSEVH